MTAPLLTPAALRTMRAIQNSNMPSAAALIAYATSRGAAGNTPRTPVIVATVPCRITNTAALQPIVADQPTPSADYALTLPAETDISAIERAIVTGVSPAGIAYTVHMTVTPLEPRSYSASVKLRASLSTEIVTPTPTIGTVIVEEAP